MPEIGHTRKLQVNAVYDWGFMSHNRSSLQSLIYMALFAALMSTTALFSLYVYTIPYTLQSFFVALAALILTKREAFGAIALYVLLGAVGLPVFAGGGAGLAALIGPTGGFIVGFVIAAYLGALVFEKASAQLTSLVPYILAALTTLVVYNLFGAAWFMYSAGMSLIPALLATVIPFVLPDLVKLAVAIVLALSLTRILNKTK